MEYLRVHVLSAMNPARRAIVLLVLALIAALAAPASALTSQTPVASDATGVIELVPDTSLFFAQADLDPSSEQVVLTAELVERAGLSSPVDDAMAGGDLPDAVQVGIAVTSIPDASDLEVADVSIDPTSAAESLDEGGYAIILASANPQELYSSLLESLQSDAELSSGEVGETQYGGVTVVSFTPGAGEEYVDGSALAMVGDYVVTGARAEDLQPLIDTFNGDVLSLAGLPQYQQVMGLLPEEYLSNGYINGPGVLSAIESSAPDALAVASDEQTQALDAWTGFSFSAEERGFRLETRSIPGNTPFEPITPIEGDFFDRVPSDALFATNGTNINANGYVTLLAFAFASEFIGTDLAATPVAGTDVEAMQAEVFAQAEPLLGFNLQTDFVDLLTGEFGVTATLGDVTSETPTIDALIVSEVSDPNTMRDTLTRVAVIVGAALGDQTAVGDRDVNGSTVNVVDISSTGVADSVEFGVVEDELVISAGSGLDDYVNGPASPMSADPSFTAVADNLPAEYGSLTYINMPVVLDVLFGISQSMDASLDIEDADPSCGEYATQAEAQAAYDQDQFANFLLDQDFDGEACEDYFDPTVDATPAEVESPYANVMGLGLATTQEDGVNGTTAFLLIGGE